MDSTNIGSTTETSTIPPAGEPGEPRRRRRRNANGENPPKARGRKDRAGQEKVVKMAELDDRMPNLIGLYNTMVQSRQEFSEAVKATAEKSGLFASVVRKFVVAKSGEHFAERRDEAFQLSLVFGESKAA